METGQHVYQSKLWKRELALKVKILFAFHSISLFSRDLFLQQGPSCKFKTSVLYRKVSPRCLSADV